MKIAGVDKVKQLPADRVRVAADSLHLANRRLALARPTSRGEQVELLSSTVVPDEEVAWAVFSDRFAVAQGRFVARLTWSGRKAAWGALKSPYPWSPYSHAGMFLEAVGAATTDTAFLTAFSDGAAVLARVGKHAHKGVPIPRGMVAFGSAPASLLVLAKRRFSFHDAAGTEIAALGFSTAIASSPTAVASLAMRGREIWLTTWDDAIVRVRLDEDPPALVMPTATTKRPEVVETKARYGPLDPSRSRSPLVIAIEKVQAWDLNETPSFTMPAPLGALALQAQVLTFYKRTGGKLRKSFDFLARAVKVEIVDAPAAVPEGIVLARLRTPSGLTQVLCRRDFATLLAANTKR